MDATSKKHFITTNASINNNNNNGDRGGTGRSIAAEDDDQNSRGGSSGKNSANTANGLRRNPSILLALDSVHRSLLLKNLQFDQDDVDSMSGTGGSNCAEEDLQQHQYQHWCPSTEGPLEALAFESLISTEALHPIERVDCDRVHRKNDGSDTVDGVLDLVKLRRDQNNNEIVNRNSRVMMMVAKYESGRVGKGSPVDETETSDFETASVSSSSCAGGSIRSSSAFSEVSHDVGSSVEGLAPDSPETVGAGESHVVTAGGATITINIINKTGEECDSGRPLRTSPEMKAVQVQVPEDVDTTQDEESTECSEENTLNVTEIFSDSQLFHTAESHEILDCNGRPSSTDSNSCYDESSEGTDQVDIDNFQRKQPRRSPKVVHQEVIDDEEEPMINIIQEMTQDLQVTSTVILNKAKLKQHRSKTRVSDSEKKKLRHKSEKQKLENSHLSRQKIIDDNFCNEILDSTIHFDRLYGITRKTETRKPTEVLSDSALQSSSVGDESFDSSMSYGKLEGKPRYSGRSVGRLMASRLRKLDRQKQYKSEGHSDSSTSNYANGPKKPPRTFAATQKNSKIGWADQIVEKPKDIDLDSEPNLVGFKFEKRSNSHKIGWTVPKERKNDSGIPSHIYNMLHYSDDETRKRLIKTSNSRAAPQSSCCHHRESTELGPKLDIDTVDGSTVTPRRKQSSEFERFVAKSSTPHKQKAARLRTETFLEAERGETRPDERQHQSQRRTKLFLEAERSEKQPLRRRTDMFREPDRSVKKEERRRTVGDFLNQERSIHFLDDGRRSDYEPMDLDEEQESIVCDKCHEKSKKQSFRKAAVRRTKSFFEASKKKINLQGLKKPPKEGFETPKKPELDTNLNKGNYSKKHLHKHLGYTPDHLQCGSCPREAPVVRNNLLQNKSAPARISTADRSRPPTRTVLNFSDAEEEDSKKQKPHEMKFFKTLKNLRISPKKLFKPADGSKQQCPMASSSPRHHGDFQSYDDLNLDNVAQMGDFLNNVRHVVETDHGSSQEHILDQICAERFAKANCPISRTRHISTSSEFLDRPNLREVQVCADLHDEPIYQEISPKNDKTIINEFICGGGNGNRYLMVNNNPNLLYATVNKTAKNLIKTKSLNSFYEDQTKISPKKLNTSTETQPSSSSSKPRRSLFENQKEGDSGVNTKRYNSQDHCNDIFVLQDCDETDGTDKLTRTGLGQKYDREEVQEEVIVRKQVERTSCEARITNSKASEGDEDRGYREFSSDIQRDDSGTIGRASLTCEDDQLFRTVAGDETAGKAPLGCIDTDDEVESLQKYEDKGLDELITCLHERIAISEVGTIDTEESEAYVTGYDTVDFIALSPPSHGNTLENHNCSDSRLADTSIDTEDVSELLSAHELSACNLSPDNSSPSSSAKMRLNGSYIYRNIRDKLRSSFRRSKKFIKNEQRKIVNLFDEKPAARNHVEFNLEEYRRKYEEDTETEEMYQTLSNTDSLAELSNQYLAELVIQIKTQCDTKKQLKQALAICRNTREFECSSELIEAERLLLLSTLKETAARNELSKIDYNANGQMLDNFRKIGVVALNHFEFPLKETAVNDMLFNYFYVVVCFYKNQVKATMAKERTEDRVCFRQCEIKFHNLDKDYEIRAEIFVLRLRKNARHYSFDSKYHITKENKNLLVTCPSPTKLLAGGSRSSSPKNFDFDNEFTRFKSQGFVKLTSSSLLPSNNSSVANQAMPGNQSASGNFQQIVRQQGDRNVYLVEDFKYLKLDSMVYSSNLLGSIGMSINSEVEFLHSDITGFLTVGESRRGSCWDWNRRWCRVNGFVLEFWNYPQECQEKLPTLQIDLTKCVNDEVELADRSACSRPRTIRLDVFAKGTGSCSSSGIGSYKDSDSHQHNQHSDSASGSSPHPQQHVCDNSKNYLLSVDTPSELKMWLNELNRVVKFLKEWKI